MNEFLYDLLVRSVLPVLIVATIGYYTKQFLQYPGRRKWRHIVVSILVLVALSSIWFLYQYFSAKSISVHVPESAIIVGAETHTDFDRSYWLLDSGKTLSLPVTAKPRHLVSITLRLDTRNLEIKYRTAGVYRTTSTPDTVVTLIKDLPTDQVCSTVTPQDASLSSARDYVFPFKFSVAKQAKLFSCRVVLRPPDAASISLAVLSALGIALILSGLVWYIYAIKESSPHNGG